jgi:hypothetical protein
VLVLVQPATVDRWHRDRFVRRWWHRPRHPGRPRIDSQCRDLIGRLADENRLWGAPRIHGELLNSESSFQNAQCHVTCENGRRDRHRLGLLFSRITSVSSNSIPTCCHRMCRAMTSSTRLRACVSHRRSIGCLRRGNARRQMGVPRPGALVFA